MDRRTFIRSVVVGLAGAPLALSAKSELPVRPVAVLGRTIKFGEPHYDFVPQTGGFENLKVGEIFRFIDDESTCYILAEPVRVMEDGPLKGHRAVCVSSVSYEQCLQFVLGDYSMLTAYDNLGPVLVST